MSADGTLKFDTSLETDGLQSGMGKVGSIAQQALGEFTGKMMTRAVDALTNLGKTALESVGSLEQNVGGVETLFGDAADAVIASANRAYETAGLSANDYMSTVTSFSASLLQSLGGDTAKAAEVADMAIIDMSDNANKMGTDMGAIQNAYQGFAKQNYTMLDNLKLGYGGTKQEMERLLADAEKISGVKYDINNLNDVYQAIHVIQGELGITGTTAAEASTTLEGSMNAAKAAWDNFMNGSGDAEQLADAFGTAAENIVKNLNEIIPRLTETLPQVIGAIAGQIPSLVATLVPAVVSSVQSLLTMAANAVTEFDFVAAAQQVVSTITDFISGDSLGQFLTSITTIFTGIVSGISSMLPTLLPALVELIAYVVESLIAQLPAILDCALDLIIGLAEGILAAIPTLIESLPAIITAIVEFLVGSIPKIIDAGITLLLALVDALPVIIDALVDALPQIITGVVTALVTAAPQILEAGIRLFMALIEAIPTIVVSLVEAIPDIIVAIVEALVDAVPMIFDAAKEMWGQLEKAIPELISALGEAIPKIFTGIVSAIGTGAVAIWDAVTSWGQQMVSNASTAISNMISKITSLLSQLPGKVWNYLSQAAAKVVSWGSDLASKGAAAAKQLFDSVVNGLKGLPDSIKAIGSNIVQGLWNGISSGWDWLKEKVSNLAKSLLDSAKEALGINSPSRAFRDEVGKFIMPGVGEGVERTMPKTIKGMKANASKLVSAMQAEMNASVGSLSNQMTSTSARATAGTGTTVYYDQHIEQDNTYNVPVATPSEVSRTQREAARNIFGGVK